MDRLHLIRIDGTRKVIDARDRFRRGRIRVVEPVMGDEDVERLAGIFTGNAGDCRPCDTEAPYEP